MSPSAFASSRIVGAVIGGKTPGIPVAADLDPVANRDRYRSILDRYRV